MEHNMKYIVLLGDGMSDYPIPELGGKTPLQAANKPNMDFLAAKGEYRAWCIQFRQTCRRAVM
jgi:2,3-bisphosphoglycerate-independent phosphoglycerate mutase